MRKRKCFECGNPKGTFTHFSLEVLECAMLRVVERSFSQAGCLKICSFFSVQGFKELKKIKTKLSASPPYFSLGVV